MPEGLAKKTKQKKALAAVKKGRPRSTSNPPDTSNKRFRGSLEERTCPLCKKVFTSALGRDYHVSEFAPQAPSDKVSAPTNTHLLCLQRILFARSRPWIV